VKFVITGLPRTRTAWFSAYFTNGVEHCYHEAIRDGINLGLSEGTADCGYALFPWWAERQGDHKLVIIERPVEEVNKSLIQINYPAEGTNFLADRLAELDGLRIIYGNINDEIHKIHEYLSIPFDQQRFDLFKELHIVGTRYVKS